LHDQQPRGRVAATFVTTYRRNHQMKQQAVAIGVFEDRAQAQRAIGELKIAGFTEKQIGVTARDQDGRSTGELGDAKGATHAKEGAVAGLAAGAGVGTLWGLGILAGVLPGIGTAIAGGTLAALVSSAAAGAAAAGLAGTLIGLGIPEDEATYYDEQFRSGRVVVTVQADDRRLEAESILQRFGGHDMATRSTARTPREVDIETEPAVTEDVIVGSRTTETTRRGRGENAPR
jgi:hypothetical protein